MFSKSDTQELSFLILLAILTAAFLWLLHPYYGALLWAGVLAILFDPLQSRLEVWLDGRRGLAAVLSLLACICVVLVPGSMVVAALAQEAGNLYNRIDTREIDLSQIFQRITDSLPPWALNFMASIDLGDISEIQSRLTSFAMSASRMIGTQALSISQGTAHFLISLGVMLYVLFFLFRDRDRIIAALRRASPLKDRHTDRLLERFALVAKATVMGNLLIAIIQGGIGGVAFWLLGIQGAVLWGVLMAVLSLLPAVGAFLVWGPAAGILFLSGDPVRGLILIGIGVLVISSVDNLLRPPLVGKGIRLPDYVVLVSTLGGLSLFGMNGFVVGPLIAALFVAIWSLFAEDRNQP